MDEQLGALVEPQFAPFERNLPLPVAEVDLRPLHRKLMDTKEGLGWTEAQCDAAELEYRRFLSLLVLYPSNVIVPTRTVDAFWHFHILDTRKYHADTMRLFGSYLHHNPYFGMDGPTDRQRLLDAFEQTKTLYENTFGVPFGAENADCSADDDDNSACRNCAARIS